MKRVILEEFMERIRLTEGYIRFYHTNTLWNDDDIFIIKDSQNHWVLAVLIVTDKGIIIRKHPVLHDTPVNTGTLGDFVFQKDYSDPDCNPRNISGIIDKMILDDPRNQSPVTQLLIK